MRREVFLSLSEDVGGLATLMGELGAQEDKGFIRTGRTWDKRPLKGEG